MFEIMSQLKKNWVSYGLLWASTWSVLVYLCHWSTALSWIGTAILGFHVANWIANTFRTAAPRQVIEDTTKKAVFITGCDTGFGHELALELDKLGFKVFAGCLYPEGKGASRLRQSSSDRLQILEIDVTIHQTVTSAYLQVKEQLEKDGDRLWALVNNAGIAALTEIEWCPIEVYQRVFDVNALGLLRVTKTFLPLVRQTEGNRIIIVTSLAGRYTFPGFSAYSMSKHAAVSFADALRLEMRKWNVSVHTVEPTLYRTPIANELDIQTTLDQLWEKCPEDIRKSYGMAYLKDFKNVVSAHLSKAKPIEKIKEVIDDLIDAVAGVEPECRYVPSMQTQLKVQILSSLPLNVLDNLLAQGTPTTPPADIECSKKNRFVF